MFTALLFAIIIVVAISIAVFLIGTIGGIFVFVFSDILVFVALVALIVMLIRRWKN